MNARERNFVHIIQTHYKKSGRHTLPWRLTRDPYAIAVSEIMLQQTQVDRVIAKYETFLKKFPTVRALAKASLVDVLGVWSGLGYNRRAKFLHHMAQAVVAVYDGVMPHSYEALVTLPGIGPYTAGAICAFAFNIPVPMVETNIRTVYLHHFFKSTENVSDSVLTTLISRTLDTKHPREWYWALMDYGSFLKSQGNKVHRKSKHYVKQSTFDGSRRQIRGAVIRHLLKGPLTLGALTERIQKDSSAIESVLADLVVEKIIMKNRATYGIAVS